MYLAGSPSGDGEEAEEETESGVGWCVGSGVGWYVGSGVGWYVDLPHHHHHHHHTAQITPQVTTGGADPSPYGRSSISVVPPRLRCSGRLRAGRYGPRRRRLPCLYMATLPKGNAVLALGLLRAAKAAGCFCACIWWWPYTRTAQGGCCDHGGATAPPCSAYPLLYSHTLTLCTAARYLFRYGCVP
jgi:hypothetical protein